MLEQNVGAGVDARAVDALEPEAALDDEHQDLVFVGLADAGTRLCIGPYIGRIFHAVDDHRGLELGRVGRAIAGRGGGVLDVEAIILTQLDALIGPLREVRAVFHAVGHRIARDPFTLSGTAGVGEAAAVHGEDAVVFFCGDANFLADGAVGRAGLDREGRRVFAHGQYAAIALALYAQQQHAVRCVDAEHLLAVDRFDARALVLDPGLVDVDAVPAVRDHVRVLRDVGVHAGFVDLPEHLKKRFAREAGLLLRIGLLFLDDLGLDLVDCRFRDLGARVGIAPLALLAVRRRDLQAVFIAHLVDHVVRDEVRCEPLVPHGVHRGVDVDGAVFDDEWDVRIDAEEIEPLEAEQNGQHDGQRLERLFLPGRFFLFAAFCDARAAPCGTE